MRFCHICGGDLIPRFADVADAQTGEQFSVFACGDCGAAQTFPVPEKLDKYYVDYHGRRHGFTADYCARRRLRWLEKSFDSGKKAKRLLDVGCGEGTFLEASKKRGWQAVGTEAVAENFRDSDLEVFSDLAEVKAKYGAESFDAITMWHTLEHFQMPREVLRQVFELLAPKGVLLVAVPDARGWQALASGKYWLHLDVPRHLFHFGSGSLDLLLRKSGFRIKSHRHQEFEYDLLGWSQSGLNRIFTAPNVFFKTLSGHRTNVSRATRAANFALGVIFSAVSLPLVWLGTICGKGGTLVVGAIKAEPIELSADREK